MRIQIPRLFRTALEGHALTWDTTQHRFFGDAELLRVTVRAADRTSRTGDPKKDSGEVAVEMFGLTDCDASDRRPALRRRTAGGRSPDEDLGGRTAVEAERRDQRRQRPAAKSEKIQRHALRDVRHHLVDPMDACAPRSSARRIRHNVWW
jgi:hypothetical protein